jgi:hypothetical protein
LECVTKSEPPCTRCIRLNIKCIGYGKRRLKFQDESTKYTSKKCNKFVPEPKPTAQDVVHNSMILPLVPTIASSSLLNAFVHCMNNQGSAISLHLVLNFGGFLKDVPRHLGRNEALDNASDALIAGYNHFRRTRHIATDPMCLYKYTEALRSLRMSLSDTETACETETMCAIQMLMIVEVGSNTSKIGSNFLE